MARWQQLSPMTPGGCRLPRSTFSGQTPLAPSALSSRQGAGMAPVVACRPQVQVRLCSGGQGRSDAGGNTGLSRLISPCPGSHHQLPAEGTSAASLATAGDGGEQMAQLGPASSQIAREVWVERWGQRQQQDTGVRRVGATSLLSVGSCPWRVAGDTDSGDP